MLDENNGLVQLPGFLPKHVAEGALEIVQQVPEVMFDTVLYMWQSHSNRAAHAFRLTFGRCNGTQQVQTMISHATTLRMGFCPPKTPLQRPAWTSYSVCFLC